MIRELLFVHHTHTDIGYTHPQPVVFELHRRFIEQALDLAEATADWPEASRFRWTCEVTGTTMDWWKRTSARDRARFLAAAERGQLEVAAIAWHMTPLMDHAMLRDVLRPVAFFRELGLHVRSAMNTDVNGLPWGMVEALLDEGVTGLSMAINGHFGHALSPWPMAFRWEAPGGRRLTAYNGLIYGVTSDVMLKVPVDMAEARERVPAWTRMWTERGYPHPFLMLQVTQVRFHDNGSPNPDLPGFVRRWNESDPEVSMRLVTISEFFDRVRAEPEERLPVLRGDWTDWWNFGAGSTAGETAQVMAAQRHLVEARTLDALVPWGADAAAPSGDGGRAGSDATGTPSGAEARRSELDAEARQALALYCEHTWGADRSVTRPESPETRTQLLLKLAQAPLGASLARMLRRDALERLAARAGGDEPRLLLWNPNAFPLRRSLRLPALAPFGEAPEQAPSGTQADFVPHGPQSHRVQRQDVVLSDAPADACFWTAPVELPGYGFVTLPAASVRAAPEGRGTQALPAPWVPAAGLEAAGGRMSNGRLSVELDQETGGVVSLQREGREYVPGDGDAEAAGGAPPWRALLSPPGRAHDPAASVEGGLRLGVPVYEAVAERKREAIFGPIDFTQPDWHDAWHTEWRAHRAAGRLVGSSLPKVARGAAHASQTFELENGDLAAVTYRLAPGEDALEIEVELTKVGDSEPHAVYLPLPVALPGPRACHFETAGAVVRLDDEQLPYASRHYLTTQRWIRMQGADGALTVATPDAPLWQVGGFTFGRHRDPDGRVDRPAPLLLAWLTNNYWNTNFQADQSGTQTFRFWLLPGPAETLGASLRAALGYLHPPAVHLYGGLGPVRETQGNLLNADVGELMVSGLEADEGGVTVEILNPGDAGASARFAAGDAGAATVASGSEDVEVTVGARAWSRVRLAGKGGTKRGG